MCNNNEYNSKTHPSHLIYYYDVHYSHHLHDDADSIKSLTSSLTSMRAHCYCPTCPFSWIPAARLVAAWRTI